MGFKLQLEKNFVKHYRKLTAVERGDLCQDFGHRIGRNQAAVGSSSDFGAVRSKKSAIASAGTL